MKNSPLPKKPDKKSKNEQIEQKKTDEPHYDEVVTLERELFPKFQFKISNNLPLKFLNVNQQLSTKYG